MNRILLVDDDSGIHELWRRFHDVMEPTFRGTCALDCASSLPEAISRMETTKYDAIILDLALPPMGPEEVTHWIANNAERLPPIIVITGNTDPMMRQRCIASGACHYFTKEDAQSFPHLFFKILYDEYLKSYATKGKAAP